MQGSSAGSESDVLILVNQDTFHQFSTLPRQVEGCHDKESVPSLLLIVKLLTGDGVASPTLRGLCQTAFTFYIPHT